MSDTPTKTKFFTTIKSRSPARGQKRQTKLTRVKSCENISAANPGEEIDDAFRQYEKLLKQAALKPKNTGKSTDSSSSSESEENELTKHTDNGQKLQTIEFIDDEPIETVIDTSDIDFSTSGDLCSHENIIRERGLTLCEDCGIELYEEISHEQDWRYFGDQDSHNSTDPSRCQYRKSPEKGIKKELNRLGFPPDICELGDFLYMTVTKGEIKRSELRKGIMFACVYESYKIKKRPKTPDVLQKKFGLNRKSMSQGITYYKLRIPREYFKLEDISAKHFIPEIMKKLSIKQGHIDKVIMLYERIKDVCSVINRSNPQSTSKAIVYYYLRRKGCNINIVRYGRIVGLSEVIILRLSGEISRILGSTDIVSLI